MTDKKADQQIARKTRSQDSLTVQTDAAVALAAGGLSLALTHEQQASADVRNPAPHAIDQHMSHARDAAGQHSAQIMSDSTTSLAVTGPAGTEHAFAIEQSANPAVSAGRSAPTEDGTANQPSSAADGAIVDSARVDRIAQADPAPTADQPAGSSDIGNALAEPLLQAPDSVLDRALEMTSTAMQAAGSIASAAAGAVAQVFDAVESLLGNQVQTVEHVANASLDLVGQATQSLHGFDALVGSHAVEEVSDVAPALLGAATSALDDEGAVTAAVGDLGGLSELVPVQLGFLGQSYADPHEPAGLLHGFV